MKKKRTSFDLRNLYSQNKNDLKYAMEMELFFKNGIGSKTDKLQNFTKFVSRQTLSIFLAKNEIFKKIKNIQGNIIECGVHLGGGLLAWGNLSAIYEPYNHNRKIIGFDTFDGYQKIKKIDQSIYLKKKLKVGLPKSSLNEVKKSIELFDLNRPVGHIPKIELVQGNAKKTIPKYLLQNKHLVVSLLYLDFDLYEPTKIAIKNFLPRMPKGSIMVFDELNQKEWPGETIAILEEYGIRSLKINRFTYTPAISYAIL